MPNKPMGHLSPKTMQARSTESQIKKYGSIEAYKAEMKRRSNLRTKEQKGNFTNHPKKEKAAL